MTLIHIHKRMRNKGTADLKSYPSGNKWISFLDKFLVMVAIVAPLMTLPQIVKIFTERNASSISLFTWLMYTIFDLPWIVYGIVHKEKPIIITYTLWALVNSMVIVGYIIF